MGFIMAKLLVTELFPTGASTDTFSVHTDKGLCPVTMPASHAESAEQLAAEYDGRDGKASIIVNAPGLMFVKGDKCFRDAKQQKTAGKHVGSMIAKYLRDVSKERQSAAQKMVEGIDAVNEQ
jgi:hypothetical protein